MEAKVVPATKVKRARKETHLKYCLLVFPHRCLDPAGKKANQGQKETPVTL